MHNTHGQRDTQSPSWIGGVNGFGLLRRSEQAAIAPALTRAYRRGDRALALSEATADLPAPREIDPEAEHFSLERLTERFRVELARKHVARSREESARYGVRLAQWEALYTLGEVEPEIEALAVDRMRRAGELGGVVDVEALGRELVDELRGAITSRRWHDGREKGQRERFEKVRACGSRVMIARCSTCGGGTGQQGDLRVVPEGCGVRRVCQKCDAQGAAQRRARFGNARGRAYVEGDRYGLRRHYRKGGRYTEKMLTLTVPHFLHANTLPGKRNRKGEIVPGVRELARDDLHARILAVWLAWPKFMRKVVDHLRERNEHHFSWHRAFEWTPGVDGIGHPHFHVYWFSPFVDQGLLRSWWGDALRAVGVPVKRFEDGRYNLRVDLRMLREFNAGAMRELLKGGRRQQIEMSRIEFDPEYGRAADLSFKYAEGWTLGDIQHFCSPDVLARLYMALEGKRLTQASSGFFIDDGPAICACCGSSSWRVTFDTTPIEQLAARYSIARGASRGPPS